MEGFRWPLEERKTDFQWGRVSWSVVDDKFLPKTFEEALNLPIKAFQKYHPHTKSLHPIPQINYLIYRNDDRVNKTRKHTNIYGQPTNVRYRKVPERVFNVHNSIQSSVQSQQIRK